LVSPLFAIIKNYSLKNLKPISSLLNCTKHEGGAEVGEEERGPKTE
jgi:hypothetical protein